MRVTGPIILTALIPAPAALASLVAPTPLILINTSPSEPMGVYRRIDATVRPGVLIAFRPPPAARAFLNHTGAGPAPRSVLKTVVAGPGALACVADGRLLVDGRRLGAVARTDRSGRDLPHWSGCRRLAAGEQLVFSDRIPNSFDSRYYGPIRRGDIIGVYAPVWTSASRAPGR
ncbi:S26 family signal peptidase [Caulobacter sp.]|uniref:S26 family signal peptidase n=1 Tax=Caulobacter sp. TaxID=78 RepID=UPI001B2ECA05|nr:S26 family signal peptidase [Caulobacter sp.]MBO9546974.1 S26 family signal peptidase [Caulobacter sp.]